jgi:hypothetical protein
MDETISRGDLIKKYFSLKFNERSIFRETLSPRQASILDEEVERIAQLRSRLRDGFVSDSGSGLWDNLENSFSLWRLQTDLLWTDQAIASLRTDTHQSQRSEVGNRTGSSAANTPNVAGGIYARVMHFANAGQGWRGVTYRHENDYLGEFPNQRIHVDSLTDGASGKHKHLTCEPDHLKYFHFPCNHTGWAEVSTSTPSM